LHFLQVLLHNKETLAIFASVCFLLKLEFGTRERLTLDGFSGDHNGIQQVDLIGWLEA
jgi:hypothetical protein